MQSKSGDSIEIIERDSTRKKLGSWKFNISDKDLANRILSHLIRKYEFYPEIKPSGVQKKKLDFTDIDVNW